MEASHKKTIAEMLAEFLREAALLIFVFVPLDALFSRGSMPGIVGVLGIATSAVFLAAGILVERMRR